MPDLPPPKAIPHPWKEPRELGGAPFEASEVPYAELAVTSNFTFLTGASHPEELVQRAAELGYRAIAIADRMSFAGIVRAHVAAKAAGIPLAIGTRLELADGERSVTVLAFASDSASYSRLSLLLTRGKRRAPKGECHLELADLFDFEQGLLVVQVPNRDEDPAGDASVASVERLKERFGERLSIAVALDYGADDELWLRRLRVLAERTGVELVATNDVHYHVPERRALQDVVTCIRAGCTLEQAGFRLFPNGERYLKTPVQMQRLFRNLPRAITRAVEVAERAAAFSLDELVYRYPSEVEDSDETPMQMLRRLTWAGAATRYVEGIPDKVRKLIEYEFELIDELDYAPYFLTVYDLVDFARSRGILCQGRGAAANSAVCYCLGVTAVDPARIDLLFERFVSKERNEPPDIDIDFEHERREEVIQYIYQKYGRERAALTAAVISYRPKSAVREVGKALGLSLDCVDRLAKDIDWWSDNTHMEERLASFGLDPRQATSRHVLELAHEILGFPRHLSQHVGGFVITEGLLSELVPIENAAMEGRTVIEWDKDDIDALGILKVDVLALGMLTCVRKALDFVNAEAAPGFAPIQFHTVPPEDPAVYDMICKADTVGVFQIESRAQMAMLPRLKPRTFYDLVIEVAIVRPGPIHGDMVHPYLRRRNGEEPVSYPSEDVRKILAKTLGVPLFQEQAMALSMVAAGFTRGEADQLRRAMAAWKRKGDQMAMFQRKLLRGMLKNGYELDFAERLFKQLEGFAEYGFPESHAASFALIVYVSCWLKKYYPAAFAAALINSQPMGFYAPAQIIRDAQAHGALVRPIDVNHSDWDCTLEYRGRGEEPALRLGMRMIKGMPEGDVRALMEARGTTPFTNVELLRQRSRISVAALRKLASADAFQSLELASEEALWDALAVRDQPAPLYDSTEAVGEGVERVELPEKTPFQRVLSDYATQRLSLKAHPVSFLRPWLDEQKAITAASLQDEARFPSGRRVTTAGLVLVRQRPMTAKGIFFVTLEDETGIANLVVWPQVFERYRAAARHGAVILVNGKVDREGEVVHVIVDRLESLDDRMGTLAFKARSFH